MGRDHDDYGFYKPSKPLQTDQGIKAKSKRGDFAKNWWATRWIDTLEKLVNPGRLRRGQRYARQGQVLSIEESESGIDALVQGSRRSPYKVSIAVTRLSDAQWKQIINQLAGQALYTAQLLTGEMPQEIEAVFSAAGASLFPLDTRELRTECNCPDPENPCKHIAAVHYMLGEYFDQDPFLLFRLRGRSQAQILKALQPASNQAAASATPVQNHDKKLPAAAALDESMANFWEMGQSVAHLSTTIKPPVTLLPVLKRLGQPAFLSRDLLNLLGPAYQSITEAALSLAYGDEAHAANSPDGLQE